MTSVGKPLGRITLRDFKAVFDRPGFYRYHIKNTDTEYGMVKEEVRGINTTQNAGSVPAPVQAHRDRYLDNGLS
jgi:hypothetical protein